MIKTEDLQFVYKTTDETGAEHTSNVLNSVTISIPQGTFTSIIGSNGSGKSTLAKHFNALLLPSNGKCYVLGIDTSDAKQIFKIRSACGMIFQNPDNQLVASIVEDDVAFAPENLCVPTSEIRSLVDKSLQAVGMLDRAKKAPEQLSGGQKQRVAIAGILAMHPDCIIFDESTSMLDPIGRRDVLSIAHRLNKEGITVVWITHFMSEAATGDRVIVLNQGNVLLNGTPKEVFAEYDTLHSIGLESTEAGEVVYRLGECGVELDKSILYEDELVEELRCKLQATSGIPSPLTRSVCLLASRSPLGSDSPPDCHSLPSEPLTRGANLSGSKISSAITLKEVSYSYEAPVKKKKRASIKEYHTVLNNISLDIPKGSLTALIGHTGSGKSTLIQLFNALLFPTEGEVYIDGKATTDSGVNLSELRKKVGLVFQYPEYQLFEETCLKDIMFGPKNLGMSDDDAKELSLRVAKALNIRDKTLYKSPFDISGGQKRLIAIAGVLAMQPQILILDEPTAGLDPKSRKNMTEVIHNLKQENPELTVVIVSHSMEDVAYIADQIIVLNEGKIFAKGGAGEIFKNQQELNDIGLDLPFATKVSTRLGEYGIAPCFSMESLIEEIRKLL